jgi:hypothetical protein
MFYWKLCLYEMYEADIFGYIVLSELLKICLIVRIFVVKLVKLTGLKKNRLEDICKVFSQLHHAPTLYW